MKDGRDDEYVACALLHDIGDTLGTFNHPDIAAAIAQAVRFGRESLDGGEARYLSGLLFLSPHRHGSSYAGEVSRTSAFPADGGVLREVRWARFRCQGRVLSSWRPSSLYSFVFSKAQEYNLSPERIGPGMFWRIAPRGQNKICPKPLTFPRGGSSKVEANCHQWEICCRIFGTVCATWGEARASCSLRC